MDLLITSKLMHGTQRFLTTYGRTALLAALRAINVEGREVVLPALTSRNTVVDAVIQAGGRPVFVEVELPSLNMDLQDLETKLSIDTKAIVSHHYYGYTATNLQEINRLSEMHGC